MIWELTYINHIVEKDARFPRDMWDYLGFYETSPEATTSKEASSMSMQIAWPVPDEMGTLSLDGNTAIESTTRRKCSYWSLQFGARPATTL